MVILKRSQRPFAWVGAFLALAGSGSVSLAADMAARAKMEEKRLVYRYQGQTIVIEGWGTDGLRVRITPEGGKQTSDWALSIPLASNATIKITPQEATIRNGKISVRIHDIPAGAAICSSSSIPVINRSRS